MTTDTAIWGTVSISGVLFVGSVAALVHIASVCPVINCLG